MGIPRSVGQAYDDAVTPLLFPTAAKDGTDLVVVGAPRRTGTCPTC